MTLRVCVCVCVCVCLPSKDAKCKGNMLKNIIEAKNKKIKEIM